MMVEPQLSQFAETITPIVYSDQQKVGDLPADMKFAYISYVIFACICFLTFLILLYITF